MTGRPAIAVFGSSQTPPGTEEWDQAVLTGSRLAQAGFGVVTGGYGGTMEAASKGAAEAGGHVIGVTSPSQFPGRLGANRYVKEIIEADYAIDDRDEVQDFFTRLISLYKNLNYSPDESAEHARYLKEIRDLVDSKIRLALPEAK